MKKMLGIRNLRDMLNQFYDVFENPELSKPGTSILITLVL